MTTRWWLIVGSGLLLGAAGALGSELTYTELRDEAVPVRREVLRVGVDVLVEGQPLRTILHGGRTYLPVPRLGTEFEIRVWNGGSQRMTAIVSVDGLSVLDSRPASETHPGYLVDPAGSIRIKGWRRDRDTVTAFRFLDRDASHASRLGYSENVGVIGLIAIEEYGRWPRTLLEKKIAGEPAGLSVRDVGGTGTGSGRDLDSPVDYVPFIRGNNKRTITIYYDTVENLRKAGVPVDDPWPVPFPLDRAR